MASSYICTTHFKSTQISKPSTLLPNSNTHFTTIPFPAPYRVYHVSCIPPTPTLPFKATSTSIRSSISSPKPLISKEEAILQAKTSISTTLEKPLNNNPKLIGKIKKLKQPKFRVEIPVIDDSPDSLSQLALDVFGDIPIKRKGSPVKILVMWPDPTLRKAATIAFQSGSSTPVEHIDIPSVAKTDPRVLNSADLAIFSVPEASQLTLMKTVCDAFYPKPVVIFNPKWAFEEESNFGNLSGFVGSFEVVYSFTAFEVKGILSKRKGVIFRCVRDGVVTGERWNVLVEEGEELKVVSSFKTRPTVSEVENVLYNLMAINSPITKSAKFIRGLVSNVTGKR